MMATVLDEIGQLLDEELRAERENERALGSRAIDDLVSTGTAVWARVAGEAGMPVMRLEESVARIRSGDFLRVIPADGIDEGESLHAILAKIGTRSWDGRGRQPVYRCVERLGEVVRLARKLNAPGGSRVLILDPPPLLELFQVLFETMDRILAAPLVDPLTTRSPKPWTPIWVSFDDALERIRRPEPALRIIQGPPGCGKTRLIAQLALERQCRGQAVLAVAFTHRALRQIAGEFLRLASENDSPPWYRERNAAAVPDGCRPAAEFASADECRGATLLVTATKVALNWKTNPALSWDLVVVDEASQLALPMILAAVALGKEAVVVGDPKQLPPVMKSPIASQLGIADGLAWLSERVSGGLGIREIRRLNAPLCAFISRHFYDGQLEPVATSCGGNAERVLPLDGWEFGSEIVHSRGIAMLCHEGDSLREARIVARVLVALDRHLDGKSPFTGDVLRYAVATPRREHVARLRAALTSDHDLAQRTIIETVDRLQGETVDVSLFSPGENVPCVAGAGRDLTWSLSSRRLNVALTRARFLTVVVANKRYIDAAKCSDNPDQASRRAWGDLAA